MILIISVIPNTQVPLIPVWNFDKLVHIVIYFCFTMALFYDLNNAGRPILARYSILIAFWVTIGFGGMLEILQGFDFIQRSSSWLDFVANCLGAIGAGYILVLIKLPPDRKAGFIALLSLAFLVMSVMLYFGVRLKGYRPVNRVHWASAGPGITFEPYGLAYTEYFFIPSAEVPEPSNLTIELAIKPDFLKYSSLRFLVMIHDGQDKSQLFIGQWGSSLMIMNGNDYSNRRRLPKIYLQLDENVEKARLVSIVSTEEGTRVYLDGVLKKKKSALVLRYPNKIEQTRMVVGNNLGGNQPWKGTIAGLAFYDRALEQALIESHYRSWQSNGTFNGFKDAAPKLLYTFDQGSGESVRNKMGDGPVLMVPARMEILQKKVLSWPKFYGVAGTNLIGDVLLNLIGFIPLGFILIALYGRIESFSHRYGRLIVVLFAFAFSLSIEITQVWIPSRDSSLLDLFLNTIGGYLGVLLYGRLKETRGKVKIF